MYCLWLKTAFDSQFSNPNGQKRIALLLSVSFIFRLSRHKKNWRGVFSFSRGAGHTYWNLKYFMVFLPCYEKGLGQFVAREKYLCLCKWKFFCVGEDKQRLVFYSKFRLPIRIVKISPLPQKAALISNFIATLNLATQDLLSAPEAYLFI